MSDLITIQGDELPRVKAAVPVRIELFALDTDRLFTVSCGPRAISRRLRRSSPDARQLDLRRRCSPRPPEQSRAGTRARGGEFPHGASQRARHRARCRGRAMHHLQRPRGRRHRLPHLRVAGTTSRPPARRSPRRAREDASTSPERDPGHAPGVLETQSSSSIDGFFEARTGPRDSLPLTKLRDVVDGLVATPEDPGYADIVAPWNLAVAVQPLVAVDAASAHDVVETVRFARRHGLTVTPQATGHGAIERRSARS